MRTIAVVGIGAGDPRDVTMRAVEVISRADVFLLLDKGDEKRELRELREEVTRRYAGAREYRVARVADVPRDLGRGGYGDAVARWHQRRADLCARLISEEVADGETGAFLVWGDPTLYDSTLAVLGEVRARGVGFEIDVVPGVSSVSALTAGHQVPLNRVGHPVRFTTGRRLVEDWERGEDDLVVMLDGRTAFTGITDPDVEIFWGAYVGMPNEILISGRLGDVADHIVRTRAEARTRHGWLMDTYLLRRPRQPDPGP